MIWRRSEGGTRRCHRTPPEAPAAQPLLQRVDQLLRLVHGELVNRVLGAGDLDLEGRHGWMDGGMVGGGWGGKAETAIGCARAAPTNIVRAREHKEAVQPGVRNQRPGDTRVPATVRAGLCGTMLLASEKERGKRKGERRVWRGPNLHVQVPGVGAAVLLQVPADPELLLADAALVGSLIAVGL